MLTRQGALTVVAEVIPERLPILREMLEQMSRNGAGSNGVFPFRHMASIHFARWFLIEDRRNHWRGPIERPQKPLCLVLSTNYDGNEHEHLSEMFDAAGAGFNRLFGSCKGYPSPGLQTKDAVLGFLNKHKIPAAAFYRGHSGRTVAQVKYEASLRKQIDDFLQANHARLSDLDPLSIRGEIQKALQQNIDKGPPGPVREDTITKGAGWLGLLLSLLLRLPLIVLGIFSLRSLEKKDDRLREIEKVEHMTASQLQAHQKWTRELAEMEDETIQNQMSHLVAISRGRMRSFILRTVLASINRLAPLIYDRGQLGGITSIHFARWAIIDKGKFLLFMSNYDGSWEDYLGEFIDRASVGLTAVWSNTVGFPHTEWLFKRGSRNANLFKAWARSHQIPTQVWYSAYPDLSVRNVNMNTKIRAGLFGEMSQAEAEGWLRLL